MCSSLSSVITHSDTKFKVLCIKNYPAIKLLQHLMRKKLKIPFVQNTVKSDVHCWPDTMHCCAS